MWLYLNEFGYFIFRLPLMEHCKRKWHKYFMYSWKRNRKYFVPKLLKLERKFFHTFKMHFYLLITTWYILTFELSVQFVRHAFHLWFLLIFYDNVYTWHIPSRCLVSRQIILKTTSMLIKRLDVESTLNDIVSTSCGHWLYLCTWQPFICSWTL